MPMSGGIEKYTEELASKLAERGHDVTVYMTSHYGNSCEDLKGFHIKTVPSIKKKSLEKMSMAFSASVNQCFADFDIVHYHAMGPSIFAFIPKMQRKNVIVQSHGIEYQRAKWGGFASMVLKVLERLSYNMSDELTVVSKPLHEHFMTTYGKESVFIPTAVELPENSVANFEILKKFSLDSNSYYFFIARLVEEKGVHYLIDAFKKLNTDKKMVIAGPLDPEDKYHHKIQELAKDDPRIIFTGGVQGEVKDTLFRGAYVFCQPSELEGMSIALLEAMSYKKCCIVSDIPENADVAEGHALMFKSKDVESLFSVLDYAEHADVSKIREIGEKAYRYVAENHTYDIVADQMETLYKSILNKRK